MKKDFFNDNKYKIFIFTGAIALSIVVAGSCIYAFKHIAKKATLATSSVVSESLTPISLSIDDALFPAVNVEVPTKEPAPEYLRGGEDHEIVADEPTTYYGPVTQAAVKVFQRQAGLPTDGIVGPDTLASIMDENAKSYSAKINDSGDDIKHIQQRLYDLGYLAEISQVSGTFGEKTEEAVRKFQERNNLNVDGTVGMQTLNTFYSDNVHANMLAFGEKSDVVLAAQNQLKDLGYMTSTPDGTYLGSYKKISIKK